MSPGTMLTPVDNSQLGSCGRLISRTKAKVVHLQSGENLGPNQQGELYVAGPQVMKGYWNNQKATDEMIDADGWLRTGDVAYYDDGGNFFIVDRLKDLIKVKGFQVIINSKCGFIWLKKKLNSIRFFRLLLLSLRGSLLHTRPCKKLPSSASLTSTPVNYLALSSSRNPGWNWSAARRFRPSSTPKYRPISASRAASNLSVHCRKTTWVKSCEKSYAPSNIKQTKWKSVKKKTGRILLFYCYNQGGR